jgi:hypothetical protein
VPIYYLFNGKSELEAWVRSRRVRAVLAIVLLLVLAAAIFGPGAILSIPLTLLRMMMQAMSGPTLQSPQQLFSNTTAYSLLYDNESIGSLGWEYNWTTANQVADAFATQIYPEQEFQNVLTQQEHWDVIRGDPWPHDPHEFVSPDMMYIDSQVQSNHGLNISVGLLFQFQKYWVHWIYWHIQVNMGGEVYSISGPFEESQLIAGKPGPVYLP